ncbi:tripartite tricarboxylate transporter substrate binding protein [Bradyrhizobium sp. LHD-71]|uniref:tripartite tricarboxylate transporter substrate binding protein n=1 Tax=Bradyrhizobium sp. LHD-71 TaxID=3072141 RepID=UPI0028101D45|nr:tripartite tricarboxylate transporter substrate binding protein [Bradyrhizobium sp. LHD-71]MDQ8729256.1 tripartite tricarboxylate transporter substrate binding protein [Bradyrhizobium sp. LHD-71]
MKARLVKTFSVMALAISAACMVSPVLADYPDKPIRMIVPYAAGGGADNVARIIGQRLSVSLGQQVIVDNRSGAGGAIGADVVAKAVPDGYTVLLDASAFAVNPAMRKLPFDAQADFVPVSLVVIAPNILVVSPSSPYKTMAEFLDYARKNPGKLSFASAGPGTASHLAGETLNELAKLDLLHVPYRGGAPALNDVMGGRVSSYFGNTASTLGHVASGSLPALAIGSAKRSPLLPDVPTLIESGLPNFVSQEWNGVFVPKGTPADVVKRLAKDIAAAVADPALKTNLEKLGLEPVGSTPEEFSKFVQTEIARAASVVKARNITVD